MHGNKMNKIRIRSVEEINSNFQLFTNNKFNCSTCNINFEDEHLFNIHVSLCSKRSQNILSKFRGQFKTITQTSYVCNICGTKYTDPLLLKHHLTSNCKYCCCKYCGKTFNSKELWSRHMDEFQIYKNCNKSNANSIETSVNILHNQNEIVNDTRSNSPDIVYMGAVKNNKSTVQTVSCVLTANNSVENVSYKHSLGTNVTIVNNSDQTETDKVNSIDSVQSLSQNSTVNNFTMNIPKEKGLCSNTEVKSLESMEPVTDSSTVRNTENNFPEFNFRDSPTSNMNRDIELVPKYRASYSSDKGNMAFPSEQTPMTHQTLHDKSRRFCCKYCDRTFSTRGPCTNHEKSHDPNGYKNAVKGMVYQSTEIQNSVPVENNHIINANPILTERKKKKVLLKSKYFVCYICEKQFPKRFDLTNHLKLQHRVNPKASTEHVVTHVNKIYTCQYCSKQFNHKSSHSNHIKCHQNKNKKIKSVNNTNTIQVEIERNEELQQENNGNNSEFGNSSLIEPSITNSTMTAASTDDVTTHSNHELHKCRYCNRQFLKKSSYSNHLKSHSHKKYKRVESKNLNVVKIDVNEGYQQEINSNVSEINSSSIEPNIAILEEKNRFWFPCDACEEKFSTPFLLVVHRRSHCIEPYLCKICNKSYSVRHLWNRHMKSHYRRNELKNKSKEQNNASKSATGTLQPELVQQQNQLKCGYCKRGYYSISEWEKHMSLNSECRLRCKSSLPEFTTDQARENFFESTRFECHICKKTYSSFHNRKTHLITIHKLSNVDLETSAITDVVEQKNKIKTGKIQQDAKPVNKKKKRLLISGDKSHQCLICGKRYSNRPNLSRHHTVSHSMKVNVLNCTVCNKSFKNNYSYRQHLRTRHRHLLNKNTRRRARDGKKSIPLMKYKNDIAQYFCKICKVEFSDNVALENHIKIHIHNKYACVDCGQKFETNALLAEHILNSNCASS